MDFALILFIALIITGLIWLLDRLLFKPKRAAQAKEPLLVEYSRSFFPVILVVFLLRSFLVEPFKIPSGSMMPTLLVGDFILSNKFIYGIRLPIINKKIIDVEEPKRGDVMVFRYPMDTSVDYIKRVVGLPGDTVQYVDKKLVINGRPVKYTPDGTFTYDLGGLNYVTDNVYKEQLGSHDHLMMLQPGTKPIYLSQVWPDFPDKKDCTYNAQGFTCKVPPGHYFMMGDNRDGSNDSRYWGFVPERNIVGKAFLIWFNLDHLKRIGTFID